jgi:hypothetical protein
MLPSPLLQQGERHVLLLPGTSSCEIPKILVDFQADYNTTYYILLIKGSGDITLSYLYIGGQIPASLFLAPNLAVRYGFIRLAESHHTSYGFGQEGRGTMLCTRVGSNELPKQVAASPCPPDAMATPPIRFRLQPVSVPVLHPGNRLGS